MRVALLHGFAGDVRMWAQVPGTPITFPSPRATWDENLAALAEVIGEADLLIGYSMGARLALGLLATRRYARGILISVNPGISDAERPARRASDAAWARMLRERGFESFLEAWEAQPLFAGRPRRVRTPQDPEMLARQLETMGLAEMPDYRGAIDDLDCTLIVGARDAKFVALARATKRPVIELPSGHDPIAECPDVFREQLDEILGNPLRAPGGE